jgi:hypothetical protein
MGWKSDLKSAPNGKRISYISPMLIKKSILVFVLLLSSCQSGAELEAIYQSWIGEPVSSYISQNGAHTRTVNSGDGGTIYIWENYSKRGTSTIDHGHGLYTSHGGGIRTHYVECFVDSGGTIEQFRWGQR